MFNQYFLNKNIEVKKTTKLFKLCLNNFVVFLILISIFIIPVNSVQSAFNQEINYQGKLTDSAGENVTDGDYNMEFNLYTTSTSTTAIWTETLTLTNKVTVTSGLFSVLLGNVTTIAGVDFNQDIYLGVNIGGSGTASWDGEMTPRKQIASVPSAFESEQLNGQPASYYLDADNLTNFGNPFYTFFNATTTDALSEGSTNQYYSTDLFASSLAATTTTALSEGTNLYWTNNRFDTRLSATTTLPNLTTILGLTNATTTQLTSTTSWLGNLLVSSNSISATNDSGLTLYDNANNGITILDGGNVGIGTTSPMAKLAITDIAGSQLTLAYDTINYANFTVNNVGSLEIAPGVSTATTTIGTGDETIRITSTGNVGIGTTDPSHQLELSTDSAAKPGTSSWTVSSDERLKDINGDFTRGLDTLAGLYPVYFNYKTDNALDIPSDREYVGLIAQDVQAVIPEAVRTGNEGFLSIESDAIFWTMLNAIKELGLKVGSDNITYERDTLQVINGTGEAQMKLAYDEENLAEFNVSATGDLALSTAGKDIRLPDDNLSVCSGGACPSNASVIEGTGNLVVENTAYIAGALGIGTSEPQRIVDIYESQSDPQMRISYDDDLYSEFSVSATGDLTISAQGGDISVLNENLRVCSDEGCPSIINEIENRGNLIVENSILALGNVGIGGTVSPDYTLDVQGTLRAYGITDASDRRLKTNIQTIDNPNTLENIQKLRGVTFEWKNSDFGTGTQVGMIAQELEEVYPDLVETDNDGFKSIQYGKFTAILLEAVKDLIDFGHD